MSAIISMTRSSQVAAKSEVFPAAGANVKNTMVQYPVQRSSNSTFVSISH